MSLAEASPTWRTPASGSWILTWPNRSIGQWFIGLTIGLTPWLALTVPRVSASGGGFDFADIGKLLTLVGLCATALGYLIDRWYRGVTLYPGLSIAAMGGYAIYGLMSSTWSALPMVSIDKAGSLGLLCVMAMAVRTEVGSRDEISALLRGLSLSLAAFSGLILVAYFIDPTMSGMDRVRIHTGGDGLIHPTASGSTASLGLLVLLVCHRIWRFEWTRRYWVPAVIVHAAILLLSNSRMSIVMLLIAGLPWLWQSFSPRHVCAAALGVAGLMFAIVVTDPGLVGIGIPASEFATYVTRGQDSSQLAAASGRLEMWRAVWGEFITSPWIGHGYAVTSRAGALTVWYATSNYLAHNMILQSLATMGIFGSIALAISIASTFQQTTKLRRMNAHSVDRRALRQRGNTALTFWVWYAGWSLFAASFLGPLRPESLVFFLLLGLTNVKLSVRSQPNNRNQPSVTNVVARTIRDNGPPNRT